MQHNTTPKALLTINLQAPVTVTIKRKDPTRATYMMTISTSGCSSITFDGWAASMKVDGIPTPSNRAKSGDPRQAPIAIRGNPFLAIEMLEMKSRRQLPHAKRDIPIVGSLMLNAIPIA